MSSWHSLKFTRNRCKEMPDMSEGNGHQTLRELIQKMLCCSQAEENMIFQIASTWGDRRAKFERDACAVVADQFCAVTEKLEGKITTASAGMSRIAEAIRARDYSST